MVRAVVFDFDGVLANSEPLHLEGLRAALAVRGLALPTDDYYAHFLGYNDEDALGAMSAHYQWKLSEADVTSLVDAKVQRMAALLATPDVLYADAVRCVQRLTACLPLAIASGAKRAEIELVLEANHLSGAFRCVVASGETPRSKPAPDPYLRAIHLLQEAGAVPRNPQAVSHCVAIEDSAWGIQSAKAAGLRCIGITTSYAAWELKEADWVVNSLAEVTPDTLAQVVGGSTSC